MNGHLILTELSNHSTSSLQFNSPFRLGEIGDRLSGDNLLSGERLLCILSVHTGEEFGLFFLVGLLFKEYGFTAFNGPCFVGARDGETFRRTL